MRATCLYAVVTVVFLAFDCPAATAERYVVLPRQGTSSVAAGAGAASTSTPDAKASETLQSTNAPSIASGSSSSVPSSSVAEIASSARGTYTSTGSATSASNPSAAASSFAGVTASPIPKGSLNVTTASNETHIEGLPIPPRITPGLSVAGALMLLTGAFYTLIGIKTKWIHIFGSSAYLVSLAVTVLILYVMHPPISDGLQGAYVAAVICTGGLLGALSLLFKDVTEGFATFLGGFCLSMWFLVLKSGGLIANDVGKITFIAIFTVSAFALYISHHTRPYGLIGSTSFGGATVIVLGIDCFSRAGLKEFWLYIWSLNDSLFPLHYHQKYPITRGIRVEIAAIVIISLAGIMSQLKVWKIIKQKREARALEQRRKDHQRNLSDEERGKKIEANNQQDRTLWEASHGSKSAKKVQEGCLDSGIGSDGPSSTRKSSLGDVGGSSAEGMELQNLPNSGRIVDEGGRVTVHVAQDDFFELPLASSQRTSIERHVLAATGVPSTLAASETSSTKGAAKGSKVTIDQSLTLQPKVVPPPFKIPDLESASDDDGSSIEASAPSAHLPDRGSKRLSAPSIFRKTSKRSRSSYHASSPSDEALMIPHLDDDRASSIAATQDGVSDHGDLLEPMNYSRSPTPVIEQIMDKESLEALVAKSHDKASIEDGTSNQIPEAVALPRSRPVSVAFEEQGEDQDAKSPPQSEVSGPNADPVRLQGNLPDGGSKVVKAYRTNEWAKHLDKADVPEIEEPGLNGSQVRDKPQQAEQAAPLNLHALQQTPVTAEPDPIVTSPVQNSSQSLLHPSKTRSSTFMPRNPFSKHKHQDAPPKAQPVLHPLTVAKNAERNPSQTSLAHTASRTSSQTSLNSTGSHGNKHRPSPPQARSSQSLGPYRSGYRSSSTPLATTPLTESPIKEDVESSFPDTRFTPHNSHLISQRDRIITSRPSSTSLLRTSYSNVALDQHPAYRSIQEDSDDIPLTKRKSFLQQNPQAVPVTHRSSAGPLGTNSPRLSCGTSTPVKNTPFRSPSNPHPIPVRQGLDKHDSTISAWRSSLKPDTTAYLENQNMEARRADLMNEKHRESTNRFEGNMKQGVRASVIDQGMRRGDMLSAHQAAMRKLQGEAKI